MSKKHIANLSRLRLPLIPSRAICASLEVTIIHVGCLRIALPRCGGLKIYFGNEFDFGKETIV